MMRVAVVTDAWAPQVNGVVRTLQEVTGELRTRGHKVEVISPDRFTSIPCPTYPEIRLAIAGRKAVGRQLEDFAPEAVHIATEGPLGWVARGWCLHRRLPFTTAYHTHFPDYLARRSGLPAAVFWPPIRRFHRPAQAIMVATHTVREQLRAQGLTRLREWSRGVDLGNFSADAPVPALFANLPRPIQLYVGRVAVEKNIEAFLAAHHPGSKVVVGEGPAMAQLQARFPAAHFVGKQSGRVLAGYYAGADVFVFPSRTDTFGLVMIEALACGTPVAAFPVCGPVDVLTPATGVMSEDLAKAVAGALLLDPADCLSHARRYTWQASADQFFAALAPITGQPIKTEADLPGKAG
jgi:glycosyltransferase involved in cell wall biosynthesis